MTEHIEIHVPDIGDFDAVEIIEIPIQVGDNIALEDTLITLESDKATMDIPSSEEGVITNIHVQVGEKVSQGQLIVTVEQEQSKQTQAMTTEQQQDSGDSGPANEPALTNPNNEPHSQFDTEVVVIGAGPGGYTAAFRAADLGKKVTLIERYPDLGGVCLNVGCIPSKALLHLARVITEFDELKAHGIDLGNIKQPKQDSVLKYKDTVIKKLTGGLKAMAKQRGVNVIQGNATFANKNTLSIQRENTTESLSFEHSIIAAGSQPFMIPGLPDDPRIVNSTGALSLSQVPKRMLVIGGGIIGLEMAAVYHALGSKITVVEMMDSLIASCDKDIVRPFQKIIKQRYENIFLQTAVKQVKALADGIEVSFEGKDAPNKDQFDIVLVAVGRKPNALSLNLANAGVEHNEMGFIPVDKQQRTNVDSIFAIGDIVGQPMLAHKATHEGKVAAEVISGLNSAFDASVIPSVAYTDPEIAWVGLTEQHAKQNNINYEKGLFPWAASGRSLSLGRSEGITKLLFDKETNRLLGAAIVGPNAGDLIAECALAIEMGSDAHDIGLTIHPHPTLSETVAMAAEVYEGTVTDLYLGK